MLVNVWVEEMNWVHPAAKAIVVGLCRKLRGEKRFKHDPSWVYVFMLIAQSDHFKAECLRARWKFFPAFGPHQGDNPFDQLHVCDGILPFLAKKFCNLVLLNFKSNAAIWALVLAAFWTARAAGAGGVSWTTVLATMKLIELTLLVEDVGVVARFGESGSLVVGAWSV